MDDALQEQIATCLESVADLMTTVQTADGDTRRAIIARLSKTARDVGLSADVGDAFAHFVNQHSQEA